MTKKKVWEKPKLLVLIKSRPEESVLGSCKSNTVGGSTENWFTACGGRIPVACYPCYDEVPS